ncbi:MAG: GIY-YIG nuclease family protein [Peptococcaceae bacterium]
MSKQYYVYIMTNTYNNVLYTGVTSNLKRRVFEHKENIIKGFTSKYKIHKLVYFEEYNEIYDALTREKAIKGGSRKKKIELVETLNEDWRDLTEQL